MANRKASIASVIVCLACVTHILVSTASYAKGEDVSFGGRSTETEDQYVVAGERAARHDPSATQVSLPTGSEIVRPVEYLRFPACNRPNYDPNYSPKCTGDVVITQTCPDGTTAAEPLYSRTQLADGTWTMWVQVSWYTCADNTDALLAAIEHEWATLTPTPTAATLQPNTGWVYANVPTIALADDATVTHNANLLGTNVQIRATPANFTWGWGDGDTTVTDDPGTAYPNQTLTHTYAHQTGDVTVTLATSWNGQYRIGTGQWVNFGTAITSQTPHITLEIRNPHSQLVACDTEGNCR